VHPLVRILRPHFEYGRATGPPSDSDHAKTTMEEWGIDRRATSPRGPAYWFAHCQFVWNDTTSDPNVKMPRPSHDNQHCGPSGSAEIISSMRQSPRQLCVPMSTRASELVRRDIPALSPNVTRPRIESPNPHDPAVQRIVPHRIDRDAPANPPLW
jgi:hypothetical protein